VRLLLDLRPLETPSARRGLGRYARELARAVRDAAPSGWRVAGLSWSGGGRRLGLEEVRYAGPRRGIGIADRFLLPGLLRRERIDLFHATAYALPSAGAPGTALVLTVHDLAPDLHPRGLSLRHRLALRRTFRSARVAERVLTISETTRRALLERYGLDPARVETVPIGVAAPFRGGGPPRSEPPFPRPFLLYVGGLDPLKNVPFLLEVLARSRRETPSLRLVVAGEEGGRREALRAAARRAGLEGAVETPGYLEDGALAAAYAGAAAFVFPSRYEGFGLPPLEAMAAGCPVVSSPGGALREVLDGAAILLEPDDAEDWSQAVLRLLGDPGERARLAARGVERARSFTWERTARATLAVYEAALRERRAA
jgi:glycosyltransferase involved in cell wall biosynthesis